MFNKIKKAVKSVAQKIKTKVQMVKATVEMAKIQLTARATMAVAGTAAESYVDTGVKILIAVVIGALTAEGDVDEQALRQLLSAAAGMLAATFHRAFDVCRDPLQAYATLARHGVGRILSSGHASTAMEGRTLLAQLVAHSNATRGPVILVGGGVRPHNIEELIHTTAATEYHSACLDWN